MTYKYGNNKKFIGAIKFYDKNKNFGFIASNKCGMSDEITYSQDFYIELTSFVNENPLPEGAVVVFQIEQQNNSRLRAVNVRRISKTKEDIELAITYYGEHETVELKDALNYNIYIRCYKPHGRVAQHVLQIIRTDRKRTPQKTLEHFKTFIEHYGYSDTEQGKKYVFDKDFNTEDRTVWEDFFNTLRSLEIVEILKEFPSIIKYISNQDIINKWIKSIEETEFDLSPLQNMNAHLEYLQETQVTSIKKIIDRNVILLAKKIEQKCLRKKYSRDLDLLAALSPLKKISNITLEEIFESFKAQQLFNQFISYLEDFKNLNNQYINNLISNYNDLPDVKRNEAERLLKDAVDIRIKNAISKKAIYEAFNLINKFKFLGDQFTDKRRTKYFDKAKNNVLDKLNNDFNDINMFVPTLTAFNILRNHYDASKFEDITDVFKKKIHQTCSIYVLSKLINSNIINNEEIIQKAVNIINKWTLKEMNDFLSRKNDDIFVNQKAFHKAIVQKGITLISSINLTQSFDRTKQEIVQSHSSENAEKNCKYLKKLHSYIIDYVSIKGCQEYNEYLESRTSEEKVLLYKYQVIAGLDDKSLQLIIDEISLDDAQLMSDGWYSAPKLNNVFIKYVLENANTILFSIIGNRIEKIEVTPESIPLIVFLLELMSINKPKDYDYYKQKEWNSRLSSELYKIAKRNYENKKLKVILWAVYLQTGASASTLKEIFSYLPPYIQIKVVKSLFQKISEGRINHDAESLYTFLGGNDHPLCLPLEITFEYLKIRSKDSNATLNNNIMIKLLEEREDHSEWKNISYLLHKCNGRCDIDDDRYQNLHLNKYKEKYYNGYAVKNDSLIDLIIPRKMCDKDGDIKDYNNSYYNQIMQYITFNFTSDEYSHYSYDNREVYKFPFNDNTHIEILNLSRRYNIKYASYKNNLEFQCSGKFKHRFCECRQALKTDDYYELPFYWCDSSPCFRPPVIYKLNHEWENYTILDFMRILNIPVDYISKKGNYTKFGHYIILNSYLVSFVKFYEHLKCRECKQLMKPQTKVTNFHTQAVNEFICADKECPGHTSIVYLNHCFNRSKCKEIIDSRDSKQCPNEQYICHNCGACCSTQNFANRIKKLQENGGFISQRLRNFVKNDLGHWEKQEFYCYICGKRINNKKCYNCDIEYR